MTEQTDPNIQRPSAVPVDFTAVLAAMQDQIDDLTSVVEAHQRRLDELTGQPQAGKG